MTGSVELKVRMAAGKSSGVTPLKKGVAPAAKAANQAARSKKPAAGTISTPPVAAAKEPAATKKAPIASAGKPVAASEKTVSALTKKAPRARARPAEDSVGSPKPAKPVAARPAAAAVPVAKKAVTARGGVTKAKLNKRSTETIALILDTTGEIILQSGADRISILDVCEKAGISRGTFYRYFSSQDDLLDAFSRHKRDQFHAALLAVTAGIDDPDARFQAVLGFVDNYLEKSRAGRLLLVAPEYALRWFQRIFNDSVHRFQDILSISFDAWEARRGITLDRELICELMVRFILSEVLVPSGAERRNLMRRIERFVVMLLSGRVARR